ncbi:MAG: hypothetical protein JXJ22_17975 [Bacteroidales bacterium]|nr:hypothetical protein [Bacteroidales bacterium]
MSNPNQIEKSLYDQILEKMVDKLSDSDLFNQELLTEIKTTDLTDKIKVKELIAKSLKESDNENS